MKSNKVDDFSKILGLLVSGIDIAKNVQKDLEEGGSINNLGDLFEKILDTESVNAPSDLSDLDEQAYRALTEKLVSQLKDVSGELEEKTKAFDLLTEEHTKKCGELRRKNSLLEEKGNKIIQLNNALNKAQGDSKKVASIKQVFQETGNKLSKISDIIGLEKKQAKTNNKNKPAAKTEKEGSDKKPTSKKKPVSKKRGNTKKTTSKKSSKKTDNKNKKTSTKSKG